MYITQILLRLYIDSSLGGNNSVDMYRLELSRWRLTAKSYIQQEVSVQPPCQEPCNLNSGAVCTTPAYVCRFLVWRGLHRYLLYLEYIHMYVCMYV